MVEDNNWSGWQSLDIYLFTNGQEQSPPRKYHLTSEQLESWDETLQQLAALHYGSQNKHVEMYMLNGQQINNPMQLKHGESYVAVEQNDIFVPAEYKKYLMRASRSWEKSQANKNLKDANLVLNQGKSPKSENMKQSSEPEIVTPEPEPFDEVIKNQLLLEIQETYLYDIFGNKNNKLQNFLLLNNTRHGPNLQVNKVKKRSASKINVSPNKINRAKSLKGITKNYKIMTEPNVKKYKSDISGIKQATKHLKSNTFEQNTVGQKPTYQFVSNDKNMHKINLKPNGRINQNNYNENETGTNKQNENNTDNKHISNLVDENKRDIIISSGIKRINKSLKKANDSRILKQINTSKLQDNEKYSNMKRKPDIHKITARDGNKNTTNSEHTPIKGLNNLKSSTKSNYNNVTSEQIKEDKSNDVFTDKIIEEQVNSTNMKENIIEFESTDCNTTKNTTNDACFENKNNVLSTTDNQINAVLKKGDSINLQLNYKGDRIEGIIIIEKEKNNTPNTVDILNLDKPLQTNINILFSDELNHVNEINNCDVIEHQLVKTSEYSQNFDSKCCGNNKPQIENVNFTKNSETNGCRFENHLIVSTNKNASTQTDWNITLLMPVRTENNDFALSLPPLELVKNYF